MTLFFQTAENDSKEAIAKANTYGASVKMVTSDSAAIASGIAGQLGIGTHIRPATDLFTGDVTKGQDPAWAQRKKSRKG